MRYAIALPGKDLSYLIKNENFDWEKMNRISTNICLYFHFISSSDDDSSSEEEGQEKKHVPSWAKNPNLEVRKTTSVLVSLYYSPKHVLNLLRLYIFII